MADKRFEDKSTIQQIVDSSSRLKFLLTVTHKLAIDSIAYIRVDGDNTKIDVYVGELMYRFKAKGTENVLAPTPGDPTTMRMELDPALAQALHEIVDDFAPG